MLVLVSAPLHPPSRPPAGSPHAHPGLYVFNLPEGTTEDALQQLFIPYGGVGSVKLGKDKITQQPKVYYISVIINSIIK